MRTILPLALCLILQACGGGEASSSVVTVEINADSIYSATGIKVTCAQMLPAGWVVEDRSVAGLTLHSLYTGYSEVWAVGPLGKNGVQSAFAEAKHTSHFVVVELGGNDTYNGYPSDRYESELRAILGNIQASGKTAVVTGTVPLRPATVGMPGLDAATVARTVVLNAIVHRLAAEFGARDAHWDTVPFDPANDTLDGIHRTEPALRLLVQRLQWAIEGRKLV